jgi:hypothetical protein
MGVDYLEIACFQAKNAQINNSGENTAKDLRVANGSVSRSRPRTQAPTDKCRWKFPLMSYDVCKKRLKITISL